MPFNPKRLRTARIKRGWTQRQLQERSAVDTRRISDYELFKTAPNAEHLEALARALGISTDWLLGLVDDPDAFSMRITARQHRILAMFAPFDDREIELIMSTIKALKGGGKGQQ